MKRQIARYYVANPYGCPVHWNGHSSNDRRCSCQPFWCDDYSQEFNLVAHSEMDETRKDKAIEEYEKDE